MISQIWYHAYIYIYLFLTTRYLVLEELILFYLNVHFYIYKIFILIYDETI